MEVEEIAALLFYHVRRRKKQNRRYWIHPMFLERSTKGAFHLLYDDLRKHDEKFIFITIFLNTAVPQCWSLFNFHNEQLCVKRSLGHRRIEYAQLTYSSGSRVRPAAPLSSLRLNFVTFIAARDSSAAYVPRS
jgi:hypothetical protein